ncbi:TIGR00730 family Rossman fold protein [Halomonas sp. McH1-25]|uniref:LOG family protein n=1 Tax=unclassified Halomonas TaxID=2609666 RepID=UPI001EF3D68A|nr:MULTISPECIES: TIGR00730 family Rossman fold protein [unclassified Halomonas]MCG7601728.1 TIGR00730 family Rossman fold protein [Halomonas sp. McH1-25]MCP1344565.1 TIGR00730 family Rossman fold protein [Halomonas sp. FL8]MCP1360705.1 TIGR00730 family Rossman fold protein [Halomonas sp. BBD45]
MPRVCVYLGSREGHDPRFREAAVALGRGIAERGLGLVYGGASIGLMGAVADAALDAGGEVIGVMPHHLVDREMAHLGLSELIRVDNMHERKASMAAHADAFVALPGGIGTLEELFEVWTWQYLGLHDKPVGLLDVAGFYQPLLRFLDNAVDAGFLAARTRAQLQHASTPESLLDSFEARLKPV